MYIQKQEYDSIYIICLTFSCIAYLRNLFDDDCFENIHIDGLNLKKVRNCDDNTSLFLQWIDEGIRDALVNKYLKKIIMLIYESSQKEVIETYTYDITYEGNEGENNLLKKLCVLTQTLKPLPKMKYIYFKLIYTENTPND
ncbi:HORMA domain-containing protein, partial [Spraguea lophii 42_110]